MWGSQMLFDSEIKTLVGTGEDELGLSILRTIINPTQDSWPLAVDNLKLGKSYGDELQILATPWSPPAEYKTNNSTVSGGKLLVEHYGDYATHLNDYVLYMRNQNVEIDVVSVQNEPDWHPDYESCDWTGEELRDFVRDYGQQIDAKLLVGESLRFNRSYTDPTLLDDQAVDNLDIAGGHLYSAITSGTFERYELAEQKGKQIWMTEWLIHEADGEGAAIWGSDNQAVWDETLDDVLYSMHHSMDINWNAYIWWWARRFYSLIGDGDAAYGTTRGQVLKRGWAFSQYSKFIRPGYTRVKATPSDSELEVTAYTGDAQTILVILNRSTENYDNLSIASESSAMSVEAFVTSRSQNRAATPVTVSDGNIALETLPARSITTLVIEH